MTTDIRYECKHVFYSPSRKNNSKDDIHFLKLNAHHPDGTVTPITKMIKNLGIPFHITKNHAALRKHKQKKQFEKIENVDTFTANRANLYNEVARLLKMRNPAPFNVHTSPYIYGLNTDSTVFVKDGYRNKYKDLFKDNTVAVLDLEADVVNNTMNILIGTLTMNSEQLIVVTDEFLGNTYTRAQYEKELRIAHQEAVAKIVDKDGEPLLNFTINLRVEFVKTPADVVVNLYKRVHELKPDFLAFWNMAFDVPHMIETLKKANIRPEDIMCDPSVPMEFRKCEWNPGKDVKVTASGKRRPLAASEKWPYLDCPASFYHIDAMCVYRTLRTKRERNYKLETILDNNLGFGKFKGNVASDKDGVVWHIEMQKHYKIEYGVYALFDCIGVELLDKKTNDLRRKISIQAGNSNYTKFQSQPTKLMDRIYRFAKDRGLVLSVQSKPVDDEMMEMFDKHLVKRNDWVIALDTWMNAGNGLRVIKGMWDIVTKLYIQVADIDVTSSYPLNQFIMNISKQTTAREIASIQGLSEEEKRSAGINMMCGASNAVQLSILLFNAPTRSTLEEKFVNKFNLRG